MVALVVTIIVLLILAGVAINLTIGQNGIFTRAQNATAKYEEASLNEQDEMDKAVNFIDKYMNGGNDDQDEHITEVEGVTIPKGFYYVGGTKADGIVISDNSADENVYSEEKHADQANIPGDGLVGNQFVWVPVETPAEFKTYKSYFSNGSTQSMTDYHEPSQEGYRYDGEETEYNLMKQSVEDNHGFYVARYEAGKENVGGVDTVVSKKGANVWNYIKWGNSMTSIGTEGAVSKAQGMYTNKEEYSVNSTLIYGVQWDAIMSWIDPAYKTTSCEADSFVRNSEGKGNYNESANTNDWKGDVATCGISDDYRVKNIYDLAGNVREWTMEARSTSDRVLRGGDLYFTGSGSPASFRSNYNPADDSYDNVGYRVALYL